MNHPTYIYYTRLDDLPKEFVDLHLPVTVVAAINIMVALPTPATGGVVQLEGGHETVRFLEVLTACQYFVNEILHAHNTVLSKVTLDDHVAAQKRDKVTVLSPTGTVRCQRQLQH